MKFYELDNHSKFTIESEPDSLFHKVGQRFDGACNAYRVQRLNKDIPIEPVPMPKNRTVKKVDE